MSAFMLSANQNRLMANYSKLVIYYFSGTGNSENVAHWMADIALEKGMEVSLNNIAKLIGEPCQRPNLMP